MTIYLVWAMETESQAVVCGFTDKERAESFAAKLTADLEEFHKLARAEFTEISEQYKAEHPDHWSIPDSPNTWVPLVKAWMERWQGKCPGWAAAGVYTHPDEIVVLPSELDP